ncbi:MAG: efflux RND transporter periplasmic adaptor subunit [Oligoflexia bacterium]|nr:efflux RND transporter periplasmic adaptor subunit [Oligoflexia bacterium]
MKLKTSNPILIAVIAALASALAASAATYLLLGRAKDAQHAERGTAAKKELYRCPMHPSVTSDHPDNCPVCHMALQKVDDDEVAEAPAAKAPKTNETLYHCPMHPNIVTKEPGDCPICHMRLQKVDEEDDSEGAPAAHEHEEGHKSVNGRTGFSLSLEKQQLIGVATTKAEMRSLDHEVRATGKVAFDPDLFTAIEEYRQALQTRAQMVESPYSGLKSQADGMVASALTKLKLMGLSSAQIRSLVGSANAMNLLLPKGSVWIYAEVFEYEVSGLKAGQKVEVTTPAAPGKLFVGKISSISPIVNSPTRTVRVRAEVPDPTGLLRPDTFANVKINVEMGERLTVPEDAVLHSGSGEFVFVVKGQGRFEPRPVTLGAKSKDSYEITSGLNAGDSVVSAANFLIDSESRLRAALQNMSKSETPQAVPSPAATPGK